MAVQAQVKKLQDRIAYLEENRRFIQNALETVLSLGEFQTTAETSLQDDTFVLDQAARKISGIIPFSSSTFYLVDEESFLFSPVYCDQPALLEDIEREVDFMIEQGLFAWAVREKRGVFITSRDHKQQYLLHVISGNSRIRGMFVGQLPQKNPTIADTSLTLLSIILIRVANALENNEFCSFLQNQKTILEKQVAIRTEALTRSEQRLKLAIEQANNLAKKARKASEAKSDFLAKMSHELRTPLNGIIGMAEIALSTELDDRQKQVLQIIDRESNVLLRIINDILDFSKVEAGKMELEHRPFDLRTIVDEVADTMAPLAFQKGLDLITWLAPMMTTRLKGDAMRVKQVLLNLTGNALKFTDKGEIFISGKVESETDSEVRITLKVKDTGIGIPLEKQAAIFEGFAQADQSTTRKYGGTGLGITISKQLVELMGGHLELESLENHGSTFRFSLSCEKQVAGQPSGQIGEEPAHGVALVVDPCTSRRQVLAEYLSSMGCRVMEACNASEALSFLEAGKPDNHMIGAIFTSLQLPEMSGLEFCRSIRKHETASQLPMVALSTLDEMADERPTQEWGYDHCLAKPIKLYELQRIVRELCRTEPAGDNTKELSDGYGQTSINGTADARDVRVLLVEDYLTNQQVAFMHLSAAGYHVDIADNGFKAVTAFKTGSYDLILMDIQMPIMDGFEATETIRRQESKTGTEPQQRIPIIAMTAHALKGDEHKCLAGGMDDFITKPIRRNRLLKTVAKWTPRSEGEVAVSVEASPSETDTEISVLELPMDFATAVEEFGDEQIVRHVAGQLLDNVHQQVDVMRSALHEQDASRLQREAHAIKGGAWTIEARPLGDLAEKIEHLSRDKALQQIEPLMERFENELVRLQAFLDNRETTAN